MRSPRRPSPPPSDSPTPTPTDACPLCGHPTRQHVDGVARQELNTMGCESCISCEHNRLSLTVNVQ